MPDLWDTNPDNLFSPPDAQPNPATGDHEDYTQEIRLKDDRRRLRLPAYVLICAGDRGGGDHDRDPRCAGRAQLAPVTTAIAERSPR